MNYGFIPEPIKTDDYIFGSGRLGDAPLQPDADWTGYLPDAEYQNLNGIEPYACVSFATLSIVEILERRIYGATSNWSDRFLATTSGTKERLGNSPSNVAETLKKEGTPQEKDYPFDDTVRTFDTFYATISENIKHLAKAFTYEYRFGYEYVPSNYESLMEALKYSPLGFSVYAWVKDGETYYRPAGFSDNHFTVCYGYKRNYYWLIFDSYAENGSPFKKVKWDSLPMQCYRFTLNRQIVVETAWSRFLKLFREWLGL